VNFRTEEDDESAALAYQAELEARRQEIIRAMTPQKCTRWWCMRRGEEHTHELDVDLARKQWLERETVSNYVKACELELYADTYKWP
jgi:hypothetical protein